MNYFWTNFDVGLKWPNAAARNEIFDLIPVARTEIHELRPNPAGRNEIFGSIFGNIPGIVPIFPLKSGIVPTFVPV